MAVSVTKNGLRVIVDATLQSLRSQQFVEHHLAPISLHLAAVLQCPRQLVGALLGGYALLHHALYVLFEGRTHFGLLDGALIHSTVHFVNRLTQRHDNLTKIGVARHFKFLLALLQHLIGGTLQLRRHFLNGLVKAHLLGLHGLVMSHFLRLDCLTEGTLLAGHQHVVGRGLGFKGGATLNLGIFLLQSKAPVEIVTHRLLFLKALCLQFFNPLTRFFLLFAHLLLKELGLCLQTLVPGFQKQIGGNNAQGKPYKEVYNCVHVV